MKKFKAVAGWLHLWTGLVTGIIVVIVSLTGCIQVFDEELFDLFHHDVVKVEVKGAVKPVSELFAIAQKAIGKKKPLTDLKISGADNSYVFTATKANKKGDLGLSYFSELKYKDDIYVDPYTGKVLGIIDVKHEFFNVVEQLHRQLLFNKAVGSVVVGTAVLLFLLMMITGFILWLPKNYKQFKQSITVKWKAKWKRVNYDLHSSLGFYIIPVAIVIAFTGLVWAFKWWETGVFKVLGSSGKISLVRTAPTVVTGDTTNKKVIDVIYASLRYQIGDNYKVIGFNLPEKKSNSVMIYTVVKHTTDSWYNMSYFYFDKRTGKMFDKLEHQDKPLALKWRNSNKYIHTGRIFGWPTQILAFLAALTCASLPITGFLIWWGKRNKKSKKSGVRRAQPVLG